MATKQKTLTVIAPYEYGRENSRAIAHGIKDGDDVAITEAARILVTCINTPVTIIPIPNSSGKAVTTLKLAEKMASLKPDIRVADVLSGVARQRAYDIKRSGKAVDRQDYSLTLKHSFALPAVLLDNCLDTARTALEAAQRTGIYTVLTYAVTTKRKVCLFKWIHNAQEAAYYKTGYKVVWLNRGDYYSPLCGDLLPMKRWLKAKDIKPYDKYEVDAAARFTPAFLRHYHIKVGGSRRWYKNETSIAYRPGFHLYDKPSCLRFNVVTKGKRMKRLAAGLYWAEVLYCDENNYQAECDARTYHSADGKCKPYQNLHMGGLNRLPQEGYYNYYESNTAESVKCICTDRIYILRILNNHDIQNILRQ